MYIILKLFSKFISLFPLRFLYVLAGGITRMVFIFWKEKRDNVYNNYSIILQKKFGRPATPLEIKNTMQLNFANYGKFNVEFLYIDKILKSGRIPEIRGTGEAEIDRALSCKKGLIMATLHFSNWDIAGITIAARFNKKAPVWAIADDLGGGYSKFIEDSRKNYGINLILPNKNLRDSYTCLENNGILNILVDRPLPRSDKSGIEVDFFGKKAYVASVAARLAYKTGAKIIVGFLMRENNWFYGVPGAILNYELSGDREKDLHAITQSIFIEAEKIITKYPEEWYMFRRMWER